MKKTECFIDQKRRLVNKQHNKVTLRPKLIWTVSFKRSLDAQRLFLNRLDGRFIFNTTKLLSTSIKRVRGTECLMCLSLQKKPEASLLFLPKMRQISLGKQ